MSRRLLAIGAHAADFVWRAGGALALTAENGGSANVLALSYGERGESGELWKEEGQTVENVKRIRHGEAERAAEALGASFRCLDLGDYPLVVEGDALALLTDAIRELAPDVIVTHTD
ncbi:MAG TPA: PIG-L family deacetylase, partial [Thermoleophilaceae bacterium]|nr:PIG-L family deacetylase [Thermoleophilaceae bacterium]